MTDSRRFGIPTTYGGLRFRSRQEATWAAFFDLQKLRWSYEPADLDFYLPDFDLMFARRPLLIEIKGSNDDIELAKSKVESTSWTGDIAVLVNTETRFVGEMFEEDAGWSRAVWTFCLKCKAPTLVAESGRWACRNCAGGNRDLWWAYDASADWRAAKNVTQWRAA